jgi:hypothetical protein
MKVLAAIGLLAIIFAVVASLYFFGGFYSVAANREDPAIVHWALMKVRTNSDRPSCARSTALRL